VVIVYKEVTVFGYPQRFCIGCNMFEMIAAGGAESFAGEKVDRLRDEW
jgi:hypothetical protein